MNTIFAVSHQVEQKAVSFSGVYAIKNTCLNIHIKIGIPINDYDAKTICLLCKKVCKAPNTRSDAYI